MSPENPGQENRSLAAILADFVHATGFADLPDAIRVIARRHVLDTLGCCLCATRLDTSRSLARYLLSEGGVSKATAIGVPQQLPAAQAEFMNGQHACSLAFSYMVKATHSP